MGRLRKDDIEGHKKHAILLEKLKELGITYNAYKQRIKNGWTEEEALLAPPISKAVYQYKGQPAKKYIEDRGGSYSTFIYHIKIRPLEEAIEITLKHKGNKKYFRDGMTLARWCEFNGKNYYTEYIKQRRLDKRKKSDIIAS